MITREDRRSSPAPSCPSGEVCDWHVVMIARRPAMGMTLRSDAFAGGEAIPRRYTEDGEDLSPPLSWSGVPDGTRELALIVDDPDAPRAEPWVHWVLYKVPADVRTLIEGIPQDPTPDIPPGA